MYICVGFSGTCLFLPKKAGAKLPKWNCSKDQKSVAGTRSIVHGARRPPLAADPQQTSIKISEWVQEESDDQTENQAVGKPQRHSCGFEDFPQGPWFLSLFEVSLLYGPISDIDVEEGESKGQGGMTHVQLQHVNLLHTERPMRSEAHGHRTAFSPTLWMACKAYVICVAVGQR